jgi:hypothetical protein
MVKVNRALALLAVTSAVVGVACFPSALDETGLLCDPTRECDEGFLCFDGICQHVGEVDAGPSNWLQNPSFELLTDAGDEAIGWRGTTAGSHGKTVLSDNTIAHSLLRSDRLTDTPAARDAGDAPRVLSFPAPVTNTVQGQVWCGSAWLHSNLDSGVPAVFIFREVGADGGQVGANSPTRVRVVGQWQQIQEQYLAMGAATMEVRIGFAVAANAGEVLWVDDAQLKRVISEPCTYP